MARKTGPDKGTVEVVRRRAGGLCELCGFHEAQQIHHRKPRRMGGTRDPLINDPCNLFFVCYPCHADIESDRTTALQKGWLVSSWESSETKPIVYRGTWRVLNSEGGSNRVEFKGDSVGHGVCPG